MLSWGRTCTESRNCYTHKSDATYWILPPYSETHTQKEIRKVLGIISSATFAFYIWGSVVDTEWLTQQVSSISFFCLEQPSTYLLSLPCSWGFHVILSKKGKSAGSFWDGFSFCWWKEQERRAVSSPRCPASPSCRKCRAVWSYNSHPETIRRGFPGAQW